MPSAAQQSIFNLADRTQGWFQAPMSEQVVEIAQRVLARAPQWVRQDLMSADPSARQRAEDTLAAMIGFALSERGTIPPE